MSERDGGDVKPECFYLCEDRCQFQAPGPHFFIEPEAGLSPGPGSEGPTAFYRLRLSGLLKKGAELPVLFCFVLFGTCLRSCFFYFLFSLLLTLSSPRLQVFDNYAVTVMIGGEPYTLGLFDTAGTDETQCRRHGNRSRIKEDCLSGLFILVFWCFHQSGLIECVNGDMMMSHHVLSLTRYKLVVTMIKHINFQKSQNIYINEDIKLFLDMLHISGWE